MLKFTYQYEKHTPLVEVTIPSGDTTLGEILESFEGFLKASGYVFEGSLDFIDGEFEKTK